MTMTAGRGSSGSLGDGGPATTAYLNVPNAVTTDASGNIYIADTYNYRIRKIDAQSNNISTVAGCEIQIIAKILD